MSDTAPVPTGNEPEESEGIQNLRDANARLRAQADDGQAAIRELAFVKAGIDTDSKVGAMFVATYDGELTSEAILTAADGLDIVKGAAAPATPEPPVQAAPTEAELRQALTGSEPGVTPPLPTEQAPSIDRAWEERNRLLSRGAPEDEANTVVVGHILGEAVRGNSEFLFDKEAHDRAGKAESDRERERLQRAGAI